MFFGQADGQNHGMHLHTPIGIQTKETGLGGFEPPTFGLEARRSILAKPQAPEGYNSSISRFLFLCVMHDVRAPPSTIHHHVKKSMSTASGDPDIVTGICTRLSVVLLSAWRHVSPDPDSFIIPEVFDRFVEIMIQMRKKITIRRLCDQITVDRLREEDVSP